MTSNNGTSNNGTSNNGTSNKGTSGKSTPEGSTGVRVRLTQMLADHCGGEDDIALPLPGAAASVGWALRALTDRHEDLARLVWAPGGVFNDQLVAFVNQENVRHLQGMDTPLRDGDEIMLITAVEGG